MSVQAGKGLEGAGGDPGIPKWVWGVAVGVPVAAALAYILFGPGGDEEPKKGKRSKKDNVAPEKDVEVKSEKIVEVENIPEVEDQEPTDPLEKAMAAKNKGNKYFRGGRYELAIKCYTEAIELCPATNGVDLATFYQNRAAANDQLDHVEEVISDCDTAVNLNNKYVKALDRRAKALRKKAKTLCDGDDKPGQVEKLKQCLEDITSVCILEGFQKQEHLLMVDAVLKELGRAEAGLATINRDPVLTSAHFITQYFTSFSEDPIVKALKKESEGDVDEVEKEEKKTGFILAMDCLRQGKYENVIAACDEELATNGDHRREARLLRATFYILRKQQPLAMTDLTTLINDDSADVKIRVNALVKRASLYIQQCKDPTQDPELSFGDFAQAIELDPENADIYHHRGQVHLLIDEINKAIVDFNKAVALNPGFPVAYVQKLYTDYRAAQSIKDHTTVNKVLGQFEEAVENFPKCVETFALYAQVLNDQQEFEKADTMYQKGMSVDPQNANLLVHRGLVALQWKGDISNAVNLIQEALELDEKCEFAYETLGTIEVQRGNLKRAIELFDKAIPLANTELEMGHLYGLRDAASAQITVSAKLGISLPSMGMGMM